ncbi:hypothetical protein Tco_1334320 [Tanacetum coccineum]
MEFVKKINKVRVDEHITLLKSMNRVFETLEANSALKETMQTMDTETILITIVKPTTKTVPEAEIIESSSRSQFTDPIVEVQIPEQLKVCLDLDTLTLINYEINGVMYQLTNKEIQAHIEKQERMENVAQEARLIELSKPEKHDAEFKVLQREHLDKLKKLREVKKKRFYQLKEIYGELEITPSLPLLEQNPSLPLGQKRKAIELEPVVRIC